MGTYLAGHEELWRGRRRVLLVLDGTDEFDVVLPAVLEWAEGALLDLVVLRVLPAWCVRRVETATHAELRQLAATWASDSLRVAVEVRRGEPVSEILATTREHRVELVLMTSARGGLVERLLRRSMLDAIRREAPMPVREIAGPGSRARA
jgi:nucleotide-binding universal stress UspA family protein